MTRLAEKLKVEPLDEVQIRRIEQSVIAAVKADPPREALRRRIPRLAWAPAAAVLAAALLFVGWRLGGQTELSVMMPPPPSEPIEVATGSEGTRLDVGDAVIEVGPETALVLARSGSGLVVDLARGSVGCEVEPRAERAPFEVLAGDVRVSVVGTVFRVERNDEVRVSVTRGKVRVTSRSGARALSAGESWTEAGGVLALAAGVPGLVRSGQSEPAPGSSAERRALPTRDASRGRAAQRRSLSSGTDRASPAREDGPRMSRRRALRAIRVPRHRPPSGLSESDGNAFEVVSRADDPRRSADLYRTIAERRRGRVASYALYSLAYLQYFELSHPEAARRSARSYLERFPGGREAEAARLLLVRAACRGKERAACREAASDYLERHPAGRNAEAAAVLAE